MSFPFPHLPAHFFSIISLSLSLSIYLSIYLSIFLSFSFHPFSQLFLLFVCSLLLVSFALSLSLSSSVFMFFYKMWYNLINFYKMRQIFTEFAENQRNLTKFSRKNQWKPTKFFKILQQKSMKTLIGNAAEKFDTQLWIFYCHSQLEFSAWKWLLFLSFMPSKQPNFYPTLTLE